MLGNVVWLFNEFNDLDICRLYKILNLRERVFIVEQDCVYADIDFKDQNSVHVQAYVNDELAAYCRLLRPGDYFNDCAVGRVIVSPVFRGIGLGHELIGRAVSYINNVWGCDDITISAQQHLKSFYEAHGFVQTGEPYSEDSIPHIRMRVSG